MKRTTTLLAILLLVPLLGRTQYRPTATLGISFGCGFADYYEQKASPLTYFGLAASPGASLLIETVKWRYLLETNSIGGAYTNRFVSETSFSGCSDSRFAVSRRLIDSRQWQRWIGIEISNFADIKYNESLMNASFAFGNFSTIGPRFQLQKDLRVTRRQHSYTVDFDYYQPLVGLICRPGYSFMGNYTNSTEGNVLDGYEFALGLFSGARTSLGLTRNFYEYKVRLSYDWQLTADTGGGLFKTNSRFVEGIHLLRLAINFRLNHQS